MRFTGPIHSMLAFSQALKELEEEGGVEGRANRYRANYRTLVRGMKELGFRCYVPAAHQGYIITAFLYPEHARFRFTDFYERLREKGMVIYAGKLSQVDTFRIANIGRLFERDIRALLRAVRETLDDMGIAL
jgi:2-aminoethylphosphonate-pyruvate transaminase